MTQALLPIMSLLLPHSGIAAPDAEGGLPGMPGAFTAMLQDRLHPGEGGAFSQIMPETAASAMPRISLPVTPAALTTKFSVALSHLATRVQQAAGSPDASTSVIQMTVDLTHNEPSITLSTADPVAYQRLVAQLPALQQAAAQLDYGQITGVTLVSEAPTPALTPAPEPSDPPAENACDASIWAAGAMVATMMPRLQPPVTPLATIASLGLESPSPMVTPAATAVTPAVTSQMSNDSSWPARVRQAVEHAGAPVIAVTVPLDHQIESGTVEVRLAPAGGAASERLAHAAPQSFAVSGADTAAVQATPFDTSPRDLTTTATTRPPAVFVDRLPAALSEVGVQVAVPAAHDAQTALPTMRTTAPAELLASVHAPVTGEAALPTPLQAVPVIPMAATDDVLLAPTTTPAGLHYPQSPAAPAPLYQVYVQVQPAPTQQVPMDVVIEAAQGTPPPVKVVMHTGNEIRMSQAPAALLVANDPWMAPIPADPVAQTAIPRTMMADVIMPTVSTPAPSSTPTAVPVVVQIMPANPQALPRMAGMPSGSQDILRSSARPATTIMSMTQPIVPEGETAFAGLPWPEPNAPVLMPKVQIHQPHAMLGTSGSATPAPFDSALASDSQSELAGQNQPTPAEAPTSTFTMLEHAGRHQSVSAAVAARQDITEPVEPSVVLRQVADAVERDAPSVRNAITVRLDPPTLGAIRVTLTAQGGEVIAHLETAHPAVRETLEGRLPELRQTLQDAGVRVGQCTVSLGNSAGDQSPAPWQQQTPSRWQGSAQMPASAQPEESLPELIPSAHAAESGVLDFFA